MERSSAFVLVLILLASGLGAESRYPETRWRPYVELDQMFIPKVGTEISIAPHWGVKGALGFSFLGLTAVGYEFIGVYHIRAEDRTFQWDVEWGLPLAYFDVFEGNVVDWDDSIDDPYAGWAPGVSLVWGYRFRSGGVLALKTGILWVFEYRWDSGWRSDYPVLPELSLQWQW